MSTTVTRVLGSDVVPAALPVRDDDGDLNVAERIVARYLMQRYASDLLASDHRLHGFQDQDDLEQDVAVSLLAHCPDTLAIVIVYGELDALDDPWVRLSVRKYVRTMLRNRKKDAYRKLKRQCDTERRIAPLDGWWQGSHLSRPADVIVLEKLDHERNIARLKRLPRKLRDVSMLRYDGYSQKEIGEALDISENAVKMRLRSVRDKGKRRLLGLDQ